MPPKKAKERPASARPASAVRRDPSTEYCVAVGVDDFVAPPLEKEDEYLRRGSPAVGSARQFERYCYGKSASDKNQSFGRGGWYAGMTRAVTPSPGPGRYMIRSRTDDAFKTAMIKYKVRHRQP